MLLISASGTNERSVGYAALCAQAAPREGSPILSVEVI